MSNITASDLTISATSGTIVVDTFTTFVFAQAQNSLGELNAQFDTAVDAGVLTGAIATWADAQALSGDTLWLASSNASMPPMTVGFANSTGIGQLELTFSIACADPPCDSETNVDFSAFIEESLNLLTDTSGETAESQTIFNLLLNGDTLLFRNSLLSIGPGSSDALANALLLMTSRTLLYGTPYTLLLRVDSESLAVNVPEPALLTLLGLGGLAAAMRTRRAGTKEHR
jgi:hypothetical protein